MMERNKANLTLGSCVCACVHVPVCDAVWTGSKLRFSSQNSRKYDMKYPMSW